MKNVIKINLIILVICIIIPIRVFADEPAQNITNNVQNEVKDSENNGNTENTLDSLNLQKNDLTNQVQEKEAQIQYIQEDMSETLLELERLSQEISDKQTEIHEIELQEIELNKYINTTEQQLEELKEKYNLQKNALQTRLVTMYKFGKVSYLDVLLNSRSLSQFLSNYYYLTIITKTDTSLLKAVEEKRNSIQELATNLETKKNILMVSRETREKTQIALSNMKIIKDKRVSELSEQDLLLHQEIENYRQQIQDVEFEIKKLALANVGERYVGGTMAWPVPGYTRITSQYGMRTHPITGVYKLHTGVDISAPIGATFVAANDGIVVKAEYNTAYGNMVMIDHGGGISTLYAHGSEILVEVGQTVFQGTAVLKVGSTGYSTGPHAHFEVRVNGSPVEPLDYITSYNSQTETQTNSETVDLTNNN